MKTFLLSALVATGALVLGTQTEAADLGGNCCSDLEERVAELEATTARKGNRIVSLEVSGQVNKAIAWVDVDGVSSDTAVIDNSNSGSRFRLVGKAKVSAKTEVGYVLEFGVDENADEQVSVRHSAIYIDGEMGRVTLGQSSTATDGIAEISLSNVSAAVTMLSVAPLPVPLPYDGGRTDLVRYDSPTLAGFRVSAAWHGDGTDNWDAALRYSGEHDTIRLALGIGYQVADDDDTKTLSGSGSIMHIPTGLFANVAYGKVDLDIIDIKGWHAQAGIEKKFSAFGATTLYGEFADLVDEADAELYGFGVVQTIDAAATDLYVSYRHYEVLDVEADSLIAGARIKF